MTTTKFCKACGKIMWNVQPQSAIAIPASASAISKVRKHPISAAGMPVL